MKDGGVRVACRVSQERPSDRKFGEGVECALENGQPMSAGCMKAWQALR